MASSATVLLSEVLFGDDEPASGTRRAHAPVPSPEMTAGDLQTAMLAACGDEGAPATERQWPSLRRRRS